MHQHLEVEQRSKSLSHLDIASIDAEEINFLTTAALKTLQDRTVSKYVIRKLKNNIAISSISKEEISNTVVAAADSSATSTFTTDSDTSSFHGFEKVQCTDLLALEQSYLSALSDQDSQ